MYLYHSSCLYDKIRFVSKTVSGRFEIEGFSNQVVINNQSVEGSLPDGILKVLGFEREDFITQANGLMDKYAIKVPEDFPRPTVCEDALSGKVAKYYNDEVGICFCNCIKLEGKYSINTSKLLHELINFNEILHSASVSEVCANYLESGHNVQLFPKSDTGKKPDVLFDGIFCDVKVIQEADWTKEALRDEHIEEFRKEGQGPWHYISDDVCYDVGMSISNRAAKGIKQAEMLLVDLSLKSLPFLYEAGVVKESKLPDPQKNRVVFFCRSYGDSSSVFNCFGYYLDLDPSLWDVVKNCNKKTRMGVFPSPGHPKQTPANSD